MRDGTPQLTGHTPRNGKLRERRVQLVRRDAGGALIQGAQIVHLLIVNGSVHLHLIVGTNKVIL